MADDALNVGIVVRVNGTDQVRDAGVAIERFGDQASSLGTSVGTTAAALPRFYEGVEQAGLKAGGAERGMRRLEYGLTAVATQSLGAESGLLGAGARMSEAALLFGYGSEAVIGVGAGFAAFGLTLKAIDAPMEAVAKGAAQLSEEFGKLAAAGHPGVATMQELLKAEQQLADVQEAAQPSLFQEILKPLSDALPFGGIQDQIDAQEILAHSAEATAKSLKPVLEELVAIGHTKDLLTDAAAAMRSIGEVGGVVSVTVPAQGPRDVPVTGVGARGEGLIAAHHFAPTPAHHETIGTGLVGAYRDALAKLPTTLTPAERTQAADQLTRDFVTEVGKSLKTAGQNLTPQPLLEGMAKNAVEAVRASGLPATIGKEFETQIRTDLLGAIKDTQTSDVPSALRPSARARLRALGVGAVGQFEAPPPFVPFGETTAPNLLTTTTPTAAIRQGALTGFSSLGNIKALDDGAKAAAKFADATDKAAIKIEDAGEKLSVTLTREIGNSVILAIKGRSPAGLLAGASNVLGTLGQQRYTKEDEAANPANVAGALKFPSLGLAATVLGLGAGLLSGLGDLFRGGLSIKDYGPVALEQLRSLIVQGGLVSMSVTNANGLSSSEAQNLIARNTSRDSVPRFPMQPAGAGR